MTLQNCTEWNGFSCVTVGSVIQEEYCSPILATEGHTISSWHELFWFLALLSRMSYIHEFQDEKVFKIDKIIFYIIIM